MVSMMIPTVFIPLCLFISPVFSANANLSRSGNYKCADVYCINLDTYSKLDVPTDPIRVGHYSVITCIRIISVLI